MRWFASAHMPLLRVEGFISKNCTPVRAAKSNAVLLAHDGATVGVGMGQVNRVDSARLAVQRAGEVGHDHDGALEDRHDQQVLALVVLVDAGGDEASFILAR